LPEKAEIQGDLPIFMRPLDGNSSDKERISAMVTAVMTQLRETLKEEQEERLAVFDSGGYSEANMKRSNEAKIKWISGTPRSCCSSSRWRCRCQCLLCRFAPSPAVVGVVEPAQTKMSRRSLTRSMITSGAISPRKYRSR
jgi:transposase